MDRRNLILSVLLVAQVAVVAFLFWPNDQSNAAQAALVRDVNQANLTGVKVESSTSAVQLAKAGDGWVLASQGDYPVDTLKVTDLISKVLSVNTARLVASTPASHNRLQVGEDEFVTRVDLSLSDGVTKTVYIGSSPSARATNVRLAGEDQVYLADNLPASAIRTDVGGWVDLVYFQVPTADAQAVTIENANGTLDFTRVNTDTWTLARLADGEVFNNNNFTTVLSRLGGLNMVAPLGKEVKPEYGLDQPTATVTVVTQPADGEEQTTTLTIGAMDEAGTNYYAKSSDSEFYVTIASFTGEQFVTDTRDRYLQPPPTPEASSTITGTEGLTSAVPITSFGALTATGDLSPVETVTDSLETNDDVTATDNVTTTEGPPAESPLAAPTPRS